MEHLEKIKEIKERFDFVENVIPAGKQIEILQYETQIIIAEELIKANDNLCGVITTLENIETAIKQGR